MKPFFRPLSALLLVLCTSVGVAHAGTGTLPLCTAKLSACVTPNWGVINPDTIAASANVLKGSMTDAPKVGSIKMTVHPVAAAASTSADEPAIKATISPTNLFVAETEKLVAALQRARFNSDGSIAKGEEQIAEAAAAVARKAGDKYVLTIYVKVPQHLRPDEATSLAKRVEAINAVLASPNGGVTKPRT